MDEMLAIGNKIINTFVKLYYKTFGFKNLPINGIF
jgi:hypothetical protein